MVTCLAQFSKSTPFAAKRIVTLHSRKGEGRRWVLSAVTATHDIHRSPPAVVSPCVARCLSPGDTHPRRALEFLRAQPQEHGREDVVAQNHSVHSCAQACACESKVLRRNLALRAHWHGASKGIERLGVDVDCLGREGSSGGERRLGSPLKNEFDAMFLSAEFGRKGSRGRREREV